MSLEQRILDLWSNSGYPAPTIPLLYNPNEYLAVIDDSGTFYRLMTVDGQIFVSINRNCTLNPAPPSVAANVYVCTKLTPILCSPTSGPIGAKDRFVLNNIIPLLS